MNPEALTARSFVVAGMAERVVDGTYAIEVRELLDRLKNLEVDEAATVLANIVAAFSTVIVTLAQMMADGRDEDEVDARSVVDILFLHQAGEVDIP